VFVFLWCVFSHWEEQRIHISLTNNKKALFDTVLSGDHELMDF